MISRPLNTWQKSMIAMDFVSILSKINRDHEM